MHTAGVAASRRLRSVSSESTLPRGRRVDPKATSVDVVRASSLAGPGEELDVLGVGARPTALDELDAEDVELLGDAQLVLDGGGHPLDLQAVAKCRVEDLDRRRCGGHRALVALVGWMVGRKLKEPPGGRLVVHADGRMH